MRTLVIAIAAALALPAAATAGGWATAGIEPLPTSGQAGSDQTFTITVNRHGQTPEDGARPLIVLTHASTGETKTFAAQPAGETGVYTATVTWPEGTWRFAVNDGLEATGHGMSQTHTFGTVEVTGAAASSRGTSPWTIGGPIALGLALAALLALGVRRRPTPATALD